MNFTLKKKSLHYFFAKVGNDGRDIYSTSICDYTIKVIVGSFIFLMFFAILSSFLVWAGMSCYDIFMTLFYAQTLAEYSIIFLLVVGFVLSLILIVIVKDAVETKKDSLINSNNTSFLAKAYRSYKEKVCFGIEIKE